MVDFGFWIVILINILIIRIATMSRCKYLKYLLLFFILIILYLKYSYIIEESPKRATLELINVTETVIYDSDSVKRVKIIKFSSDQNLTLYESIFYGRTSNSKSDSITNNLFIIKNMNRKEREEFRNKYIYEVSLDYSILPDNIETDVVCHIEFPPVIEPNDITYEMVIPYKYLLKDTGIDNKAQAKKLDN